MGNTYYVIEKQYKGFFIKKHVSNKSYIVTTLTKTGEGIVLIPIGKYKGTDKIALWTQGFYDIDSEEIISMLKKDVSNLTVLEKLQSTTEEITNNNIDYFSVQKWEAPFKLNIKFKTFGKYIQSNIKSILFSYLPDRSFILIADMKFSPELDEINDDQIEMVARKAQALFKAKFNHIRKEVIKNENK